MTCSVHSSANNWFRVYHGIKKEREYISKTFIFKKYLSGLWDFWAGPDIWVTTEVKRHNLKHLTALKRDDYLDRWDSDEWKGLWIYSCHCEVWSVCCSERAECLHKGPIYFHSAPTNSQSTKGSTFYRENYKIIIFPGNRKKEKLVKVSYLKSSEEWKKNAYEDAWAILIFTSYSGCKWVCREHSRTFNFP